MVATNDAGVKRYALPGVPTPLLEDDVANKAYVDSQDTLADYVIKLVDETRVSTTVFADDAELKFNAKANKTYLIELTIFFKGVAAADWKFQMSIPGGGALARRNIAIADPSVFTATGVATTSSGAINSDDTIQQMKTFIRLINLAVADEVVLQWAQASSNAGDSSVLQGSTLKFWESA